ncbi:MAG TPA: pilus assembly protein N-terminal domain-containing protein, partial [Gemmataceae bacterium]|nr:pilus assembly protein N-terminal domain-containing protein [Gemmataceae bacterium]
MIPLLFCLAAWLRGTAAKAQQGPLLNLPPPEPERPVERARDQAAPVRVESTLPKWKAGQPEALKPPMEILKSPAEILKQPTEMTKSQADASKPPKDSPKLPCPPGIGGKAAEQCDQNVPGVACPSPKDQEENSKYIKEVLDPKHTLTLYNGRTRLMNLWETPKRVQIGNEEIVDITLIGPKQVSLLAKKLGDTVLNLWFTDPADRTRDVVIGYLVRVVPDPEVKATLEARYQKLAAAINAAFPDSRVCLFLVGDKLAVQGQAKDIAEATQILHIARSNAPRIDEPKLPYNVSVNLDAATANRDRLRDYLEAAGPYVINLLRIPGEQQVWLKVTVAEINRSAARSIGLNFSYHNKHGDAIANTTGNIAGTTTGLGLGAIQGAGLIGNQGINGFSQAADNIPAVLDSGRLILAIDALRNLNYARTLAEPGLLALDGQTATLQAGGQFPTPQVTGVATAVGLQSVEFIPFGVQLSFTPYITDRDRVRLSLSASV